MKTYLLLLLFTSFIFGFNNPGTFAQSVPVKIWDKSIGGSDEDILSVCIPTSDGNFLLGGSSLSGVSGDKTEPRRSNDPVNITGDFWLVKVNSSGAKIWDKTYGGDGGDYIKAISPATDGGFLLAGSSYSNISGEKSQACKGGNDYWIVKIDASGKKLWDKTLGGNDDETLETIIATPDGGFLLCGISETGISGDKSQASYGSYDYWVVKIDGSGNKVWDKTFGGYWEDHLRSVIATSDGGFLLAGHSNSPVSGNKILASYGSHDFWLVKINATGTKQWETSYGGTDNDKLFNIVEATGGGYILSGESNSSISGTKTASHKGNLDFWIVKVDTAGVKQWDRSFGGSNDDNLRAVQKTVDGGYLFGGDSRSGITGDKTEANRGFWEDFWLVKTDSSGSMLWNKTIGGTDEDHLYSINITADGGMLLAGYSDSDVSGDMSSPNKGWGEDYCLVKLAVATGVSTVTVPSANFCAGSPVSVGFTAAGNFTAGNIFTAELSNVSGSFTSPLSSATLSSTALTGTINLTIPVNATPGNGYRIRVTASTPGSTSAINGNNLTVNPQPSAKTGTAQTICFNTTTNIGDAAVSGNTYNWTSNPAGFTSTSSNPSVNPSSTTTYTLTETITLTGCSKTNSVVITVDPVPDAPVISMSGPGTICDGENVVLTSSASAGNQWYKDGNIMTGATNAGFTATANGVYTVAATSNSCTSVPSAGATVIIHPIPATPVITAGGPPSFCQGGNVILTSSAASGNQWYKDGTVVANGLTYTASQTGTYTATVTQNGCISATSLALGITVNNLPAIPAITATGNILSSSAAAGNQWYLNGTLISAATGQTYTAITSGQYTVQVTQNGCSTTSASFNFVTTGIVDPSAWNGEVKAYPNPVVKTLFIKNTGSRFLQWELLDVSGRKLYAGKLPRISGTIDMERLTDGIYQLLLTDINRKESISLSIIKIK